MFSGAAPATTDQLSGKGSATMPATRRTSTAAKTAAKKTAAGTKAKKTAPARLPRDSDYAKSTNAFPMTDVDKQPRFVRAPDDIDDTDYAASTNAYPMSAEPGMQFVEAHLDDNGKPIDFAKSVDRYPMYGENEEGIVLDPEQPVEVRFPTPGPQSSGQAEGPKGWQAQRDRMNLDTGDPTGGSDTEWTPDQVEPQPGQVDGVPHTTPTGEPMTHEAEHAATDRGDDGRDAKTAPSSAAKVVKPPARPEPVKQTQAETKTVR